MSRWYRWAAGSLALALIGLIATGAHFFSQGRQATQPLDQTEARSVPAQRGASSTLETIDGSQKSLLGGGGPASPALPAEERKYLWEVEHVAFLLDVHTFPLIARALRDGDPAALAGYFIEQFHGTVPDRARGRSALYPFGEFRWFSPPDQDYRSVERDGLVSFLMDLRNRFPSPPRVEVRLMRLSPEQRADLDGPWRGTMKLRLAGERVPDGPSEIELLAEFSFRSPDDDLARRERWVESYRVLALREYESDHYLLKEVAADRGMDRRRFHDNWDNLDAHPVIAQVGAYICDYDHDGRLDVLISDVKEWALFRGTGGGQFVDATAEAGLRGRVQSKAGATIFVDLDGDGYEELLIGTQIFRNNRDGTFSDVTALSNLRIPSDAGAFAVADYDLDGRMDIYVLRASPGPVGRSRVSWIDDQTGPGNLLYRNQGEWRFRNVTNLTKTSAGHRSCFSAVWFDANQDGRPDLAVSDEFGSSLLLVNRPDGTFTEHALKEPFGGFCMGIVAGDLDNDGFVDLYLANMYSKAGDRIIANLSKDAVPGDLLAKYQEFVTGNEFLRNRGDLQFEALGRQVGATGPGWAYGPNLLDLNNDGWLDIYAPGGFLSYERGEPDG